MNVYCVDDHDGTFVTVTEVGIEELEEFLDRGIRTFASTPTRALERYIEQKENIAKRYYDVYGGRPPLLMKLLDEAKEILKGGIGEPANSQ